MSTLDIKEIRAEGVPANTLYSQGVIVGNMVFLAGVTGVDPATGSIVTGTVGERTVCYPPLGTRFLLLIVC
jgi:enamine deaminase RidA (YjgF/YER057c/UK114 family)